MNPQLLEVLQRLRNEMVHGREALNLATFATRLQDLGVSVPTDDVQWFVAGLLRGFEHNAGEYFVPPVLLDVVSLLLAGRSARDTCDPWAGLGVLASKVHEVTRADRTLACYPNEQTSQLAQVIAPQLEWHTAGPLAFLDDLTAPLDVVASVLPFGVRATEVVELTDQSGGPVRCSGDMGQMILAAASMKLSPEGIALYVVTPSFFSSDKSILRDMPRLGLGIEAALALPQGGFAPFTTISTYLVIVRKQAIPKMFVAQLSQESHTNRQIVANLRDLRVDGAAELGRLVDPIEFRGMGSLALAEQLRHAEEDFGYPAVRLGDLAHSIRLGRPGDAFEFSNLPNAVYVPLIGLSDVAESAEDLTLKQQNYAQVVVDTSRSDARFVARFLNSELGRAGREASKSGATIKKLHTSGVKELAIFIPDLQTQTRILEIEARLEAEHNTLLGLQSDLASLRRDLWAGPRHLSGVESRLREFSLRLSGDARPHAASTLEDWFETLPFPLASILRAWQATPSEDYKTKYEHLLHFFEAAAEFVSLIFLSAFSSNREVFVGHRDKIAAAWKKQNLSLERATFGTWKTVVEYLGRQTRDLLAGDSDKRALCAELFADPRLGLPQMLSRAEVANVLAAGNKLRNDWSGHGGIVGTAEAQLRNEKLLSEVQRLRDALADGWQESQLVQCRQCKPRNGRFDNDLAILVGSNSDFLSDIRSMSSWLDVERLYIVPRDGSSALLLMPLMRMGPSPVSAQNACYFFNRVEKDGIRFVSYHFIAEPERKGAFVDTSNAIKLLTENEAGDIALP